MSEVSTINTGLGENGMSKFGYLDRLNGMDKLPFWRENPCNNISASEGSFFPPREVTKSDILYVYDKDLCRIIPLKYVEPVVKDGKQTQDARNYSALTFRSSLKVLTQICTGCREMFSAVTTKRTNASMKTLTKPMTDCRT